MTSLMDVWRAFPHDVYIHIFVSNEIKLHAGSYFVPFYSLHENLCAFGTYIFRILYIHNGIKWERENRKDFQCQDRKKKYFIILLPILQHSSWNFPTLFCSHSILQSSILRHIRKTLICFRQKQRFFTWMSNKLPRVIILLTLCAIPL